ncbi:MAG: PDZ domain-containing protein [Planctomycetes bacterium]|nr:PDZ domain-containing protein [Planctomycetota bacterium]
MRQPLALAVLSFSVLPAQEARGPRLSVPPDPVFSAACCDGLAWRNLGPANPMGRTTDIAVHPARQSTWFVGTAGGGVFRTRNAGTTWDNVFDDFGTVSIGDIAIAPSNPDIVWIGTGEENARNSVQWGDGLYRSTDGGETWTHAGLFDTFQIGHIAIHPTDPDVVYVAALGRLWGESAERGLYRTRDGGANWQRVLWFDDRTGCIDVRIHPTLPEVVFACMYERMRNEFDDNDPAVRFGAHSGLYKSTDGGDNWRRLEAGLPGASKWGRSGIDLYGATPDTMFAIVETERSGWATGSRQRWTEAEQTAESERQGQGQGQRQRPNPRGSALMGIGTTGEDGDENDPGAVLTQITEGGAAETAGLKVGDRVTKIDEESLAKYQDLIDIVRDSRGGQKVKVTYVRDGETAEVELTYGLRQGGDLGRNPDYPNGGRLFGQKENVQDKQGDDGFETGGVFRSTDRGETWIRINSLTERPFYYSVIRVDPQDEQNLYAVGTTLWGSGDGGAKFSAINRGIHVDFHTIWVDPDDGDHLLAGCDGGVNETFDRGQTWQVCTGFCAAQYYDVCADNSVPYNAIGGLQDNGTWVGPSRTRYREGITAADWFKIRGGDGFGAVSDPIEPWIVLSTSQNGAMGVGDTISGGGARLQRDRPAEGTARWNWDSPFMLSPHNRLTIYHAGSHVYRGERHQHLPGAGGGEGPGAFGGFGGGRGDGIRMRCISGPLGRGENGTAVSLAESPRVMGLLYTGTDDGALWRSDNGGTDWQRIDQNLPILAPRYVSDIWPSQFASDRVYVTLDGHRFDDFKTYVFVSQDRGDTWQSLGEDLPLREPCYAFAEDPRNENLLFLGTEYGCHVSLDRGQCWFRMGSGLPTVSVRDLFIQDRDSDLVAGTHGRGVWIVDIEPLRQLTAAIATAERHLFAAESAILWRMTSRGFQGHRDYRASNPPYGATFYVWLATRPEQAPVLTIHDVTGKELTKVEGKARAGLQAIQWDARLDRRRLAEPGQYAVRWQGQDALGARAFALLPDPASLGTAGTAASPTQNR